MNSFVSGHTSVLVHLWNDHFEREIFFRVQGRVITGAAPFWLPPDIIAGERRREEQQKNIHSHQRLPNLLFVSGDAPGAVDDA